MSNVLIPPTVGRVVWFYPSLFVGEGGFAAPLDNAPLAAIIARVWSDTLVNLAVFDVNGDSHSRTSVRLFHEELTADRPSEAFCTWMPFQKGQAKAQAKTPIASAADVAQLLTDAGGKVESAGRLPDGSGFMTASFPLPADHWLTKPGRDVPPMPFRVGTENPRHREIVQKIYEAGKYALRGATMQGADMDLDPDALLQNLVVGLIGYHTPDGTSSLCGDPHDNPSPLPPLAFV